MPALPEHTVQWERQTLGKSALHKHSEGLGEGCKASAGSGMGGGVKHLERLTSFLPQSTGAEAAGARI